VRKPENTVEIREFVTLKPETDFRVMIPTDQFRTTRRTFALPGVEDDPDSVARRGELTTVWWTILTSLSGKCHVVVLVGIC
jgi:hypothetical protein